MPLAVLNILTNSRDRELIPKAARSRKGHIKGDRHPHHQLVNCAGINSFFKSRGLKSSCKFSRFVRPGASIIKLTLAGVPSKPLMEQGTLSLQVINSGSRSFVFTVSGLGSVSQFQPVLIDDKKNLHLETKLQYQVVDSVRQLRGGLWHRIFRDNERNYDRTPALTPASKYLLDSRILAVTCFPRLKFGHGMSVKLPQEQYSFITPLFTNPMASSLSSSKLPNKASMSKFSDIQ